MWFKKRLAIDFMSLSACGRGFEAPLYAEEPMNSAIMTVGRIGAVSIFQKYIKIYIFNIRF